MMVEGGAMLTGGGDNKDGTFYSMANPAAAPMAATTTSLLKLRRLAAPVKAAVGAGEVKVPLDDGAGEPVEATVGTWIWPSEI